MKQFDKWLALQHEREGASRNSKLSSGFSGVLVAFQTISNVYEDYRACTTEICWVSDHSYQHHFWSPAYQGSLTLSTCIHCKVCQRIYGYWSSFECRASPSCFVKTLAVVLVLKLSCIQAGAILGTSFTLRKDIDECKIC